MIRSKTLFGGEQKGDIPFVSICLALQSNSGSLCRFLLFRERIWTDNGFMNVLRVVREFVSCAAVGAGIGAPFGTKRICALVATLPVLLWLLPLLLIGLIDDGR
jgi:hypothetical protein